MKHWIQAFRLRTLPLALSCILAGHGVAALYVEIDVRILILSILTTVFLQVLSNLANDYGDTENGADHAEREGPSRAVQAGLISQQSMKKAVFISVALSLITGLTLLYIAIDQIDMTFLTFFLLGIASIIAAVKYTMGKNPYGYKAMGDIFVFLFFGLLGVIGTFWLQVGHFEWIALYPAIAVGLLSVAVLNMNNMRDVVSDTKAGKVTIPILLGEKDKWYHLFLIVVAIVQLLYFNLHFLSTPYQYLSCVLVLPFLMNIKTVLAYKARKDLDPELKKIALTTFVNSLYLFIVLNFLR